LLRACGDVVHIDDELMMDAVTAVSGSGPAYVFLLAEVMAAAGRKLGLPADVADRLARQTVAGSGALLAAETAPASQLRVNVTSEGGTTAAALAVLMAEGGMLALFDTALAAAAHRAQELDRCRSQE
jgi:pyrroline-5-carboxylate reductase